MKIILVSKTGIFHRSWTKNTDTSGTLSFQSIVENNMFIHVSTCMFVAKKCIFVMQGLYEGSLSLRQL